MKCKKWFDRDLVAVNNISYNGWVRFAHSIKGVGKDAVVSEYVQIDEPPIRIVDPTKLFSLSGKVKKK